MPQPSANLGEWWRMIRDHPQLWKQIVALYHTSSEDEEIQQGAAHESDDGLACPISPACPTWLPHKSACERCDNIFRTSKQRANRMWSTQHVKSEFRKHIPDITECPHCKVHFFSRARLINHLAEKRIRSRLRSISCQAAVLAMGLPRVPDVLLNELEARDSASQKS